MSPIHSSSQPLLKPSHLVWGALVPLVLFAGSSCGSPYPVPPRITLKALSRVGPAGCRKDADCVLVPERRCCSCGAAPIAILQSQRNTFLQQSNRRYMMKCGRRQCGMMPRCNPNLTTQIFARFRARCQNRRCVAHEMRACPSWRSGPSRHQITRALSAHHGQLVARLSLARCWVGWPRGSYVTKELQRSFTCRDRSAFLTWRTRVRFRQNPSDPKRRKCPLRGIHSQTTVVYRIDEAGRTWIVSKQEQPLPKP